jgi:hypothetical protein
MCNKGKTGNELISILQSILKLEGKKMVLHCKEYQNYTLQKKDYGKTEKMC